MLGVDPAHGGRALRERIGIVLQTPGVYPFLTPREAVRLFASYYPRPRDPRRRWPWSGSRRRPTAACAASRAASGAGSTWRSALVGDPDLLFLDEPTTGFDPEARRAAWEHHPRAARRSARRSC